MNIMNCMKISTFWYLLSWDIHLCNTSTVTQNVRSIDESDIVAYGNFQKVANDSNVHVLNNTWIEHDHEHCSGISLACFHEGFGIKN